MAAPAAPPLPAGGLPGLGAAAAPGGGAGLFNAGIAAGRGNLRGRGAVAQGPNRQPRHVKLNTPKKLEGNENQQQLDQWHAHFVLYYSRDDSFQYFLGNPYLGNSLLGAPSLETPFLGTPSL